MPQATDDDLTRAGKNERSRTLAKLYHEMAESESEDSVKAAWEQAARMAEQMIEE